MRVYSFAGRNAEGDFALAGRVEIANPAEERAVAATETRRKAGAKKYRNIGCSCPRGPRKQKPALPSICPTCGSSLPAA